MDHPLRCQEERPGWCEKHDSRWALEYPVCDKALTRARAQQN